MIAREEMGVVFFSHGKTVSYFASSFVDYKSGPHSLNEEYLPMRPSDALFIKPELKDPTF